MLTINGCDEYREYTLNDESVSHIESRVSVILTLVHVVVPICLEESWTNNRSGVGTQNPQVLPILLNNQGAPRRSVSRCLITESLCDELQAIGRHSGHVLYCLVRA